jgi:UDP-N-acetylglucosamine 2-epimerase (non-hydrolysing)
MTLRENTERPVTITEGTNRLARLTTEDIVKNYRDIKKESAKTKSRTPKLWDGQAARRLVRIIANTKLD